MARQQPETKLVGQIKSALERKYPGSLWIKIHGGPYQNSGISDLIGCLHGTFIGLEVKVPGREKTLTKKQELFLRQVEESGGIAEMVTSVEEALSVTKRINYIP